MGQVTDFACLGRGFCEVERPGIGAECAQNGFIGVFQFSQPKEGWFHVKATLSCAADRAGFSLLTARGRGHTPDLRQ